MPSDRQQQQRRPFRKQKSKQDVANDVTGVQKIKSALRQTRRLLAKDNLAADKRVETERRLKSLEADLEVAESKRKERALAMRYHKIKFFERTKVLRKIKQCKREIAEQEIQSPKHAATDLENHLFELRSQLLYILHFPRLEKYISLFPGADGDEEEDTSDATSARRQEILGEIQEKMRQGVLGNEPEEVDAVGKPAAHKGVEHLQVQGKNPVLENLKAKRKGRTKGVDPSAKASAQRDKSLQEDDFFEHVDAAGGSD